MWNYPWPHLQHNSQYCWVCLQYISTVWLFFNYSCCFHYDQCHHSLQIWIICSSLWRSLPASTTLFSFLQQVMTFLHHSNVKVKDLNIVPIFSLTSSSTTLPLFNFLQSHCYSSISSVLPQGLCTYYPLCLECSTWPCGFSSLFSSGLFLTMSSPKEAKSHDPI